MFALHTVREAALGHRVGTRGVCALVTAHTLPHVFEWSVVVAVRTQWVTLKHNETNLAMCIYYTDNKSNTCGYIFVP